MPASASYSVAAEADTKPWLKYLQPTALAPYEANGNVVQNKKKLRGSHKARSNKLLRKKTNPVSRQGVAQIDSASNERKEIIKTEQSLISKLSLQLTPQSRNSENHNEMDSMLNIIDNCDDSQ